MHKYLMQVWNYIEFKVLAGIAAAFYTTDVLMLLCIFLFLELMDIFTKWIAISKNLYCETYKDFPNHCYGVWIYIKYIPTARRMRKIKSGELRVGFCNKMLTYLLLLLLSMCFDGALTIAYSVKTKVLLGCTTTVLATTECLSVLENLEQSGVEVITQIKQGLLNKLKLQK